MLRLTPEAGKPPLHSLLDNNLSRPLKTFVFLFLGGGKSGADEVKFNVLLVGTLEAH